MGKTIIFNWKMNPETLKEAKDILNAVKKLSQSAKQKIIIASPFVYLETLVKSKNKKIELASQDVFWQEKGSYTGEISPTMLKNMEIEWVIIGHSERRQHLNETDEMINKKVLAVLKASLKVILCVGENSAIRKKGDKTIMDFIKKQLDKDLKNVEYSVNNLIIAYEPIWAIGTGIPCKSEDAVKIIKFVKKILNTKYKIQNTKILYGGSVNGENIVNFVKYKEIDGVLVGAASLKKEAIKNIINKFK